MDWWKSRKLWLGLLMSVLVVQTWAFWTATDMEVTSAGWLLDDAFFYAVIAEHLVSRGAMEFYPGMETNGYQPLWMALITAAHGLVPGLSALAWIRGLSVAAYLAFAALAMWVMTRDKEVGAWAAAGFSVFVLLQPSIQYWVLNGLETAVTLVVFLGAMIQSWRVMERGDDVGIWYVVALALLGVLCFLARTDLFVVSLVLAVWLLRRLGWDKRVWIFGGVTAACVVPYLAFNWVKFGALVPLSGQAQQFYLSLYHGTLWEYLNSNQWHGVLVAFAQLIPFRSEDTGGVVVPLLEAAVMVVPVGAGYAAFGKRRFLGEGTLAQVFRLFAIIVGLHLLVMYGYHRGVRSFAAYYFAPTVMVTAMIVAYAVARRVKQWLKGREENKERRYWAIGVGAAVALWLIVIASQTVETFKVAPNPVWEPRVALSLQMDERADEEATIGAYWPGALAYFTKHELMPLDGVIASAEFQQEVMREQAALPYLCEHPSPMLTVYLNRRPETWAKSQEPPQIVEWSAAYKEEMWEFGMDRFEVVGFEAVRGDERGWYLLRVLDC